jgi:protein-S-isoprenylcysteine O-methyltransferase Ste14
MTIVMTLLPWVSAFSSFGWGMLRFFRRTAALNWQTAGVAVLGSVFSGWHCYQVIGSNAELAPRLCGFVLLSGATMLFWWAVRGCGTSGMTAIFEGDVPCHLVRRGPYAYVRHPFYASYTMFWFGGAIASGSISAWISAGIMLGIYLDAIAREERKFASSMFAGEYAEYRRRAGVMTPRLVSGRGAARFRGCYTSWIRRLAGISQR